MSSSPDRSGFGVGICHPSVGYGRRSLKLLDMPVQCNTAFECASKIDKSVFRAKQLARLVNVSWLAVSQQQSASTLRICRGAYTLLDQKASIPVVRALPILWQTIVAKNDMLQPKLRHAIGWIKSLTISVKQPNICMALHFTESMAGGFPKRV